MITESDSGPLWSYAVANLRGQKGEDKYCARISHSNPKEGGIKSIASFGVFDGHSSKRAAEECSSGITNNVVLSFAELLATTGLVGTLNQQPNNMVNSDSPPDPGSATASFLVPAGRGITGSIHGSVHSGSLHSSDAPVLSSTPPSASPFVASMASLAARGTADDEESDDSGFIKDASVWQNTGAPEREVKVGLDILDQSCHSQRSTASTIATPTDSISADVCKSSFSEKITPNPVSAALASERDGTTSPAASSNRGPRSASAHTTPRNSSHGAGAAGGAAGGGGGGREGGLGSSHGARTARAQLSSTPARREQELMQENVLLSAKKMLVHEVLDALLVESIFKETYNMDKRIKSVTASGATSVTLYVRKQADGTVRAVCANIGDSRCVCVTAVSSFQEIDPPRPADLSRKKPSASSSSSSSSSLSSSASSPSPSPTPSSSERGARGGGRGARGGGRGAEAGAEAGGRAAEETGAGMAKDSYYNDLIVARLADASTDPLAYAGILREAGGSATDLAAAAAAASKASATREGEQPSRQRLAPLDPSSLPDSLYALRTRVAAVFLMSEDHNLSLPRERLRIMSKTLPPWSPLPVESFEPYLPAQLRSGLLLSRVNEPVSIFEVGALIAKKVNPYLDLDSSEHGGGLSSSAHGSEASLSAATEPGLLPPPSGSSSPGHGLRRGSKWDSAQHLSAMAERESEVESEITRRSRSGSWTDSQTGANDGPSALESVFLRHSANPSLSAKSRRSVGSATPAGAGAGAGAGAVSPQSLRGNLACALGVGNTFIGMHARAVSGQYLETSAPRLALATRLIKKVRATMHRFGAKGQGWNGTTTKLSAARSVTDLEAIELMLQAAERNSEHSMESESALVTGAPAPGSTQPSSPSVSSSSRKGQGPELLQFEHKESFIARRMSSDGRTVGPEALFGRQNVSIMMTRSMGDKVGPRSCVAFPEIAAVTVPVRHHARFVLASDGFWDVVSIDTVRLMALTKSFKSNKTLAAALAQKAARRRGRANMRMDDITVLVVDINPDDFVHVDARLGLKEERLVCHRDGRVDVLKNSTVLGRTLAGAGDACSMA